MDAREYLNQGYKLDQRINSKLEALSNLNDLSTKCTATYSDMPRNPNRGSSRTEDTIVKIIDLEHSINDDIDRLVDLKRDIIKLIGAVKEPELQMLLELRYVCYKTWEQVAVEMYYSIQHIHRLHDKAIAEIDKLLAMREKEME